MEVVNIKENYYIIYKATLPTTDEEFNFDYQPNYIKKIVFPSECQLFWSWVTACIKFLFSLKIQTPSHLWSDKKVSF